MSSIESRLIENIIDQSVEAFSFTERVEMGELKVTLETIKTSLRLGGSLEADYDIPTPKFLLSHPLTLSQRKQVDDFLGSYYAQESVELQDKVTQIPIKENYEPMVFLSAIFEKHKLPVSFSDIPFNPACEEWANKPRVFWTRQSLAEKLVSLGKALATVDLFLHFEDAFRPVGVQEGLFKRRIEWILKDYPEWDDSKVITEARSKTAVTPRLASHKSGAAVDITLRRFSTGEPLDLGNKYPEGGALVALDCPFVTYSQWQTRQIFANSVRMAGLEVYPGEDWHASYGDNLHAFFSGKTAKFGPVKDFSLDNGRILEVYSPEEFDRNFLNSEVISLMRKN